MKTITPMILVTGLTKRFGRLDVLRGLDLRIGRGRVTAVVGPNGSGKTTLIKSILGLVRPDGGEIQIDGRPVRGNLDVRSRIGYMPQAAPFPENLTGADVIAMLRDLRGPGARTDETLVHAFGLEGALHQPLRTLSGGTRQKVSAVIAFLFDPDLLILDEPTAGLDPVAGSTFKDKVQEAKAHGKTFLLTSHIMSEVEELADDLVYLLDGHVRFEGPVESLKRQTGQARLERALADLLNSGVAA